MYPDFTTKDNGIYRPVSYFEKAVGFDGKFWGEVKTIFVKNESVAKKLLEMWNRQGRMNSVSGFYPRYEYTIVK